MSRRNKRRNSKRNNRKNRGKNHNRTSRQSTQLEIPRNEKVIISIGIFTTILIAVVMSVAPYIFDSGWSSFLLGIRKNVLTLTSASMILSVLLLSLRWEKEWLTTLALVAAAIAVLLSEIFKLSDDKALPPFEVLATMLIGLVPFGVTFIGVFLPKWIRSYSRETLGVSSLVSTGVIIVILFVMEWLAPRINMSAETYYGISALLVIIAVLSITVASSCFLGIAWNNMNSPRR